MPSKKKKELQVEHGSVRQISNVALFSKRARTWIVAACSIALICFVLLPLGLDRLSSANTQEAASFRALEDDIAQTPEPSMAHEPVVGDPSPEAAGPTPTPSAEVHVSQYSTLQLNDVYPAVEQLHSRLVELGYLESDEPSETYNEATAAAVALFQRTLDLEMTGVADSALQEQLFSDDAASYEMKLGDNGSDVRGMQSLLAELGYYTDKVNGYFGVATEEALKAFQQKNGMDVDGVFNTDDRDLLYSPDAKPAVDPTPTPKPATPKPAATSKPTTTKKPTATQKPTNATQKPSQSTPVPDDDLPEIDVPDGADDTPVPIDPSQPEPATPAPTDPPSSGGDESYGSGVNAMIECAEAQLGKRYVLGDEGPNTFDCSGLVYYCLTKAGVKTTRYSAKSFARVDKWTLISSMSDLKRGDLLFFTDDDAGGVVTHTGIYIGGNTMIDASSRNGKVVKRSCTTSYWTRNFVCARRVF